MSRYRNNRFKSSFVCNQECINYGLVCFFSLVIFNNICNQLGFKKWGDGNRKELYYIQYSIFRVMFQFNIFFCFGDFLCFCLKGCKQSLGEYIEIL